MVLYHLSQQNFCLKLHIIGMFKKFPFQKYILLHGSGSIMTDEIGKFRRPNLFSIPVKNI